MFKVFYSFLFLFFALGCHAEDATLVKKAGVQKNIDGEGMKMPKKILRIESSVRLEKSVSRQGTQKVVDALCEKYPGAQVLNRELGRVPLFQMTEAWYEGCYLPEDQRTYEQRLALADSDVLIDELMAADFVVIGAPMNNFSIPACLKAYIDQICRIHKTFSASYEGLAKGKQVFVVMSRGGRNYEPGESAHSRNHEEPYLKEILGFMGMKDVTFFPLNGTASGPDVVAKALEAMDARLKEVLA